MAGRWFAVPSDESIVTELSKTSPTNAFTTLEYFAARQKLGYSTWVLGFRGNANDLQLACGGFIKRGRLRTRLEVPSLPPVLKDSPFWDGLQALCRKQGVTHAELNTFDSMADVDIPPLGAKCFPRKRVEFVIHLGPDWRAALSPKHKSSIKRAKAAGLVVRRTRSTTALKAHQALMEQSMERRRLRGEKIASGSAISEAQAFLEFGAGELFQALAGESVLSSMLVLRAPAGGYSHTAGTSPEGLAVGASHFLMDAIAEQLRADGARTFNLGGADDGSSLAQYKQRFGALRIPLAAAQCAMGPAWRRAAATLVETGLYDRGRLHELFTIRKSHLLVYAAHTDQIEPAVAPDGATVRSLSSDDLLSMHVKDKPFQARQLARYHRFEASYAYGVFLRGKLAHVSWLLPPPALERDEPPVLDLDADEAEITGCETLPEFRGHGIYPFAVRTLMHIAQGKGVRRILMKTTPENTSSQSGILKAGLKPIGSMVLFDVPGTHRPLVWRRYVR